MMFKVTSVYSDGAGESHFKDILIPLKDVGDVGSLSAPFPVTSMIFREVAPSYDWDFHCAPQQQYIILLEGEIEIETSLGDKRKFKQGDILLMVDTTGKGHKTKNILPFTRKSLFITV